MHKSLIDQLLDTNSLEERSNWVKLKAQVFGFDAVGIAEASPIDPENRLGLWLDQGYHASMDWMRRTQSIRRDVKRKLPGAKSVVVLIKNYYSPRPDPPSQSGRVAAYAWGRDYHRVLRKPLRSLAEAIAQLEDGAQCYASVDSGPVLERPWAQRAGVASIGKNTLALRRDLGSWFFLATVITTVELSPDAPATDLCGSCTACLDACPTGAFPQPYVLDANRCISYQTIENRGVIPQDLHSHHGEWVFGCDICQEVCPWNRFAQETAESDFHPRPGHANPDLRALASMPEDEFRREFSGTPLLRAKWRGMIRNALIALGNIGT